MFQILITDPLSEKGLDLLRSRPDFHVRVALELTQMELSLALQDSDAIIIRSGTQLTQSVLKKQERLSLIVRAGVGLDNVDASAASHAGIAVRNTPTANTVSTAEHTITLMLSAVYGVAFEHGVQKTKHLIPLRKRTLAIIGLGRVGQTVARRMVQFGMNVRGFDPYLPNSSEIARRLGIEYCQSIECALESSDFVTLHTPLTNETRGLLNERSLKLLNQGALVVNCARGGIAHESALLTALETGQLSAVALDVFETEPSDNTSLICHPQVLVTPHIGAFTHEAQENVSIDAAQIVLSHFSDGGTTGDQNSNPPPEVMTVALRLAFLVSQLHGYKAEKKVITRFRTSNSCDPRDLRSVVIRGLLHNVVDHQTHPIDDPEWLWSERGIELLQSTVTGYKGFSDVVTLEVLTSTGGIVVAGSFARTSSPRLVSVDQFRHDAELKDTLLICRHVDTPGVTGAIGRILAEDSVNINHVSLGREHQQVGSDAVAVYNLPRLPSTQTRQRIQNLKALESADFIDFSSLVQ